MCNRSTLRFIQRKNTMDFDFFFFKCKACVLDGSFQSSGLIITLRTGVDRTKAETSRDHRDMIDFPPTQDQPVDGDL